MKLDSKVSLVNLMRHLAESAPKMLKKGEPEFEFTLTLVLAWQGLGGPILALP